MMPPVARILIVDDDPVTADHFARVLRGNGFDPVVAYDAHDGLGKAACGRFDAMLVDLRMPSMDGIALIEQCRGISTLRRVPAAIITGDYLLEDAELERLHAHGAVLRFKPLWIDDLLETVQDLLATQHNTADPVAAAAS